MAQGDPPFNPISNALAPTPVPGTVSQTPDNPMDFINQALAEDQPNDNGLAYLSADQLNELKEQEPGPGRANLGKANYYDGFFNGINAGFKQLGSGLTELYANAQPYLGLGSGNPAMVAQSADYFAGNKYGAVGQRKEELQQKADEIRASAPQGDGFAYQLGTFIPQALGIVAATASAPFTAGTSLSAIPAVLSGATMATLVGSSMGEAMNTYDDYMKESGKEGNEAALWGVGLAAGGAEYFAERLGSFNRYLPKGAIAKATTKIFAKGGDEFAQSMFKQLAKSDEFTKLVGKYGWNAIKHAGEEGFEEVATELGNIAIEYAYKGMDDGPGFDEMKDRVIGAFEGGALMGGIISPVSTWSKSAMVQKARQKRGYVAIAKGPTGSVYEVIDQRDNGDYDVIDAKGNQLTMPEETIDQIHRFGVNDFNKMLTLAKQGKEVTAEMQAEAELNVEYDRIKATVQKRRYTGADQFEFIVNGQKQTGAPAIVTAQKADGSKWQILSGSVNDPNPGQPMIGINLETGERAMLSHKDVSNIDINSSEQMETDLMQEAQMRMNNKLNAQAGIERAAEFNPGDAVTFNGLQGEIINASDPTQGVQLKVTNQEGKEEFITVTQDQLQLIQPSSSPQNSDNSNLSENPTGSTPATPEQIQQAQPQKTMTVGKKQLAYEEQGDGSYYVPFADGKDETKAITAEVDDTQFDVVPVIEEVPIAGAPAFAKKKSNTVVKGVKIIPKSSTNEQDLQGQAQAPNDKGLSTVQPNETVAEGTQAAEDRREEQAQYTEAQGEQPIIQTEAYQTPASQDTEKSDNTVAGAISPKQEKNPYEGMSEAELAKQREKIINRSKRSNKKKLSKEQKKVSQMTYSEPYQIALQYFATGGKINPSALFELYGKAGKENDPDVKRKVESERRPRFTWVSKHDGLSIKTIADKLWEQNPHLNFDSMDYREAVEEAINSFTSPQQMAKKLLSIVGDETATIDEHTKLEQEYYATQSEGMDDDSPEYDEQLDNELDQEENIEYAMNLEALVDDGRILYLLSGDINAINENGEIDWNVVSLKLANDPGYYTGDFLFDFNEQELNRIKELANENTANQRAEVESGEVNSEPDSSGETSITPASEQGVSEEAEGQPEEVTPEQEKAPEPELTASQKAVSSEIDSKVNDLKAQLAEVKANRNKKLAELQNRNSLFGDTQNTGNTLFETDDTFDTSKEAINKAIQPFTNQITDLERQIEQLTTSKTNAVKQAGNQIEIPVERPQFAGQLLDKIITNDVIAQEEAKVDTNPSEAQIEAGNYKKGHITVNGFDISIENPKGSTRSGTDSKGKKWSIEMQNSYGYFKGTKGYDGDQIDVFLGDNPLSDKVFVVDQVNQDTGEFDESKIMLGFSDAEQAKQAYLSNYSKDWKGFKAITETTVEDFKTWLYDGAKQRKPYNEYKDTPEAAILTGEQSQPTEPVSTHQPESPVNDIKNGTKEPWQMTAKERYDTTRKRYIKENGAAFVQKNMASFDEYKEGSHKKLVQQALSEGKKVPEEVLRDYPELKKKEAKEEPTEVSKPIGIDNQIEDAISGQSPEQQQEVEEKAKYAQNNLDRIVKINGNKVYDVAVVFNNGILNRWELKYNLKKTGNLTDQKYYYPIQYAEIEYTEQPKPQFAGEKLEQVLNNANTFDPKESDVNYETAYRAYSAISFDPEKRAKSVQEGYVADMKELQDKLYAIAKTQDQKQVADAQLLSYKEGYLSHLYALLNAKSRTMSSMITGPANFPVARNQKALNTEQRRLEEFTEWEKKAIKRATDAVKNAATPEQKEDKAFASIKKSITSSAATIIAIDKGQYAGSRALFVSSITGLINRMFKNGQYNHVIKSLDYISEINGKYDKPIITNKNSIWALRQQSQDALLKEQTEEGSPQEDEVIYQSEGIEVVNNKGIERVQIITPSKPSQEVINELKSHGWKWSPSNKAWQRKNTVDAIRSAERFANKYFPKLDDGASQLFEPSIQLQLDWDSPSDVIQNAEFIADANLQAEAGYDPNTTQLDDIVYAERMLTNRGYLHFVGEQLTGPARIKTPGDIAYIFKNLESSSSENMFFVMLDDKGNYQVLYLTTGTSVASIVDIKLLAPAIKEFGATRICMVHNHPTGNLIPSDSDRRIHDKVNDISKRLGVKAMPSIIINTDSGQYTNFTQNDDFRDDRPEMPSKGNPKPVEIYQFDRMKLYVPSKQKPTIRSSNDIAIYLSKQKRGTTPKLHVIILDRRNAINKYMLVDETISQNDLTKLLHEQIGKYGESAVLASNNHIWNIPQIQKELLKADIQLLDVLEIKQDKDIINNYESLADQGLLEPDAKYGNDGSLNPKTDDIRFRSKEISGSPYWKFPNVRNGWTKDKIRKALKETKGSSGRGAMLLEIAKFDSPEEFKEHIFYHGTGTSVSGSLKPSITMSQREAENSGGGGYGERYYAISVSRNKNIASNFTALSSYGTVYPVILKKGAKVIERPDLKDAAELEDIIEELFEQKVDAVKLGDWNDGYSEQELAVINPKAIYKYENSDSYAVYGKKRFENLTDQEIETIYNKANDRTELFAEIRKLPREERDKAIRELVNDIRFRQTYFYSTTEKALSEIKQEKGTVAQFKAMLIKNGAKQAEMDWMGFDSYFGDSGQIITKSDVQNWIDLNRIELEEVVKGGMLPPVNKNNITGVDFSQQGSGSYLVNYELGEDEGVVEIGAFEADNESEAIDKAIERINSSYDSFRTQDTKYAAYKTPGGEDYREWLLTMPAKAEVKADNYASKIAVKYGLTSSIADRDQLWDQMNDEERRIMGNLNDATKGQSFKSSHWDEPNVVVHIRTQEFTDAQGQRVLMIEEVQSDWAQQGKKEGFKSDNRKAITESLRKEKDNFYTKLNESEDKQVEYGLSQFESGKINREQLDKILLANGYSEYDIKSAVEKNSVPDMPFKTTDRWIGLAMRRLIQYASDNGFDKVAWTTGEQQAERYDLSKQVDEISTKKETDGTYSIIGYKGDESLFEQNEVPEDEIEKYVGKDLAKKIIDTHSNDQKVEYISGSIRTFEKFQKEVQEQYGGSTIEQIERYFRGPNNTEPKLADEYFKLMFQATKEKNARKQENNPWKTFNGVDLKVGGEGMKAFYDNIIPAWVSKNWKRFGAKVETTQLDVKPEITDEGINTESGDIDKEFTDNKYQEVHSVEITPALRQMAQEPQPLFRKEENILDYYIHKADTQKEYADKAKELGRKYNVPIRIITNRNQLPPRIKNRMKSNRVYPGVFDVKTGEIYVLVNEVQDLNDVELTIAHEIVAHKGLRELVGNEAFDQLCDDVYYSMHNADINNIAELYNTNDRKEIADEYMAQLAETGKFPNWFGRVIARVRNMLRKAGLKARYSDADIMYLLWESRRRLTKQGAAGYIDYKASESDVVANVRFSVSAYHGSPYDFEQFSTEKIGTGEGAQAYGWGLYFTDKREIAKTYSGIGLNIDKNKNYDYLAINDAEKWVKLNTNIHDAIIQARSELNYAIKQGYSDLISIRKQTLEILESNIDTKRNLYKTTLHPDKTPDQYDYLRWDKPFNADQFKKISNQIKEEKIGYLPMIRIDTDGNGIIDGSKLYTILKREIGSAKEASLFLLRAGIDGIQYPSEYTSKGTHEDSFNYVVFDENAVQVEDHIRFRISPDNKPRMLTARGDKFREFMQDKMLSVRKLQELVQQRGGTVPQAAQVYEAENRASSRSKAQIEDYNNNEQSNLIDTLVKIDKPIPEINLYLKAKSSLERNDNEGTMAISEDKDDEWNREYVTKIITDFENDITPELTQELWDNVKACTDFAIKKLYLGNVISKDAYNGMKKRKFYVPLKNWQTLNSENPEDYYDYITGADRTAYQGLKKAHGRSSEADDPLAYIEAAAHSAVATANKNMVKHKALMLVRLNHQMTDLFNLNRVYLMDKGEKDDEGKPIYYNVIKGEDGHAMRIARFDAQGNPVLVAEGSFEQLLNDGIIIKKITREHSSRRPSYLARQHEVKVYENGDLYVIAFGDPRVANALNNYEMPWLETATRIAQNTIGIFNRWLTANFTAKNPAFIPVNWIKDTGYASTSHSIKDDGELKAFTENYPKCVQAIHRYLTGNADKVNNEFDKLYQAFREFGGETGYVHLVDIKTLKKDIEREVNRRKGVKKGWDQVGQRKAIKKAGELLNYMALMSENSSRFATFVAAVKAGRSYEQAATEAKNITVNFNRKGRLSGLLGSFYGFFNATVQGGHNFAYMAKHHGKNMAIATGTFYLAAVMIAELMRSVGPEDEEGNKQYDKLPLWVRQTCLTIPDFSGNFITIPLPPGFRSVWAMGITTSDMIHGKSTAGEATFDMISSITEMFSPFAVNDIEIRQGKVPYRTIIPTTLIPLYDAATNQDFTGRKLFYVPYTKDLERYTPKTEWAPQNVNGAFKTAAELINKLGGGDENRPAGFNKHGEYNGLRDIFFNLNPAIMEHTAEYYLGGRGKFFNELYKTVRDAADPKKEVQSYNIPIIKRLYTKPYAGNVWEDYREIGQQVKDFDYFLKNAQKTGDIDQITTMIDRQEMLVISAMYKQYSKAVQAYSDAIPYMNNPEEVKEMRKKRELLIKDFMQRVSEVKDTDNNKDDEPTIITTTK